MSGPLILGIESSCDETGVGIVRGHELLANEVASSVDLHVRFGGVVPEVASRAHLEAMVPTLQRACATADIDLTELDGIAVTAGPGLMGALVVGLAAPRRWRTRWTSRSTGSTTWPGTSPSTCSSTARCRSRASRCWSPAGTPRCCRSTTSPPRSPSSARPSTTRPARRTTRWPGCSGCPIRAGPHIDRAATGDPRVRGLPARPDRAQGPGPAPLRLLLLRAEDRGGPVGRDRASATAATCRWPTWPPASRRRSATC